LFSTTVWGHKTHAHALFGNIKPMQGWRSRAISNNTPGLKQQKQGRAQPRLVLRIASTSPLKPPFSPDNFGYKRKAFVLFKLSKTLIMWISQIHSKLSLYLLEFL
jgi:hypothetical protein